MNSAINPLVVQEQLTANRSYIFRHNFVDKRFVIDNAKEVFLRELNVGDTIAIQALTDYSSGQWLQDRSYIDPAYFLYALIIKTENVGGRKNCFSQSNYNYFKLKVLIGSGEIKTWSGSDKCTCLLLNKEVEKK